MCIWIILGWPFSLFPWEWMELSWFTVYWKNFSWILEIVNLLYEDCGSVFLLRTLLLFGFCRQLTCLHSSCLAYGEQHLQSRLFHFRCWAGWSLPYTWVGHRSATMWAETTHGLGDFPGSLLPGFLSHFLMALVELRSVPWVLTPARQQSFSFSLGVSVALSHTETVTNPQDKAWDMGNSPYVAYFLQISTPF